MTVPNCSLSSCPFTSNVIITVIKNLSNQTFDSSRRRINMHGEPAMKHNLSDSTRSSLSRTRISLCAIIIQKRNRETEKIDVAALFDDSLWRVSYLFFFFFFHESLRDIRADWFGLDTGCVVNLGNVVNFEEGWPSVLILVIRLEKKSTFWGFFSKEAMVHFGVQFSHTDLFIPKEYL